MEINRANRTSRDGMGDRSNRIRRFTHPDRSIVFMQLHVKAPLAETIGLMSWEPFAQASNPDAACRKAMVAMPAKTSMKMLWTHLDKFSVNQKCDRYPCPQLFSAHCFQVSLTACALRCENWHGIARSPIAVQRSFSLRPISYSNHDESC